METWYGRENSTAVTPLTMRGERSAAAEQASQETSAAPRLILNAQLRAVPAVTYEGRKFRNESAGHRPYQTEQEGDRAFHKPERVRSGHTVPPPGTTRARRSTAEFPVVPHGMGTAVSRPSSPPSRRAVRFNPS